MAARNEGSVQHFKHVFRHCLINGSEIARKKIARPGLLADNRWATGSGEHQRSELFKKRRTQEDGD